MLLEPFYTAGNPSLELLKVTEGGMPIGIPGKLTLDIDE